MAVGQIKQKQSKISKVLFENLCSIQCTKEEICAVLEISDKTLDSWCNTNYNKNFSDIFKEKRELGKSSLRRKQWNLAEKNPTMAIWLGKQYLGQKDIAVQEINGKIESPVIELVNSIDKIKKEDN